MRECKRIAVIQRGKSGNCFPAEICEGESARSCEARVFPPRAPPFRARKLLQVVEMCSGTGGAMDAAVLDMKRCADLFLFSTTFSSHSLTPIRSQGTPTFPPCRPAQRRRPQTPTVKPQANSASPTNRPAQR